MVATKLRVEGGFCLAVVLALLVVPVLPSVASPSTQGVALENQAPVVVQQVNKSADMGASLAFSATATDAEGDTLRYTWDFGDGSGFVVSSSTAHAYAKPGFYNFTVFVDDLTDLPGHNVSTSAEAKISFPMALMAGWNFVTVPVVGWGYKANNLGLLTGDVVVKTVGQNYIPFIVGITDYRYNFPINPGEAYWIWVGAARALHLYGTVPTTIQTINVTVPSIGGWFAVGLASLKSWHAHDIAAMYSGPGRIAAVVIYRPYPYHVYATWLPPLPGMNDFLILPGMGIWVYATAPGVLTYDPVATPGVRT